MNLNVEVVKPAIGAIVHVDRANLLDKAVAQQCLQLIERHSVVVFPRANLDNDEQRVFTENLL